MTDAIVTDASPVRLGWSCYHLKPDEAVHEAGYGARLIYEEVVGGAEGVVWDRQGSFGPRETIEREIFPVLKDFYRALRWFMGSSYAWRGSGENGRFIWRKGRVLVVGSPQGSYGYLYLTALLEKEGHEGESQLMDLPGPDSRGERATEGSNADAFIAQTLARFDEDYQWGIGDKNKRFQAETLKKRNAFKTAFGLG